MPAGEENIQDHAYKYLTTEEMKGLGDDSMQIDVTNDEKDKKDTLNRSRHFTILRNSFFVFFVMFSFLDPQIGHSPRFSEFQKQSFLYFFSCSTPCLYSYSPHCTNILKCLFFKVHINNLSMLDPDRNPEPEVDCITVPVPPGKKVAVPVPEHCLKVQSFSF